MKVPASHSRPSYLSVAGVGQVLTLLLCSSQLIFYIIGGSHSFLWDCERTRPVRICQLTECQDAVVEGAVYWGGGERIVKDSGLRETKCDVFSIRPFFNRIEKG